LVTTTLTGGTVTVEISEGQFASPATVAAGGVALDPLTEGLTMITAAIPGLISTGAASHEVGVTAP
jgi:hypothetical protein